MSQRSLSLKMNCWWAGTRLTFPSSTPELFKIMTFLTSVLSYYKTRIVSSLKTWISSRECYNQKDEWILRLMNGYVMVRAVHKVQTFTALDSPLIPSSFSCSLINFQSTTNNNTTSINIKTNNIKNRTKKLLSGKYII